MGLRDRVGSLRRGARDLFRSRDTAPEPGGRSERRAGHAMSRRDYRRGRDAGIVYGYLDTLR